MSRDGGKVGLVASTLADKPEIDDSYTAAVEGLTEEALGEVVLEGYTADYKGIKFEGKYVVYWTSCC